MYGLINKISKGVLPLLIFIVACYKVNSQPNLVPNASFEIYTSCPKLVFPLPPPQTPPWIALQVNGISYLNVCANMNQPAFGVPYNYLVGNNYQPAYVGNGYVIICSRNYGVTNYKRIYQEVKLSDSLRAGKKYYCGFYVCLSDGCKYATNNIAMLITKTATIIDTILTPSWVIADSPQIYNYDNPIIKDTQNWVKISRVFTAQGGEQYITIGNFKQNNETRIDSTINTGGYTVATYALDDVFVTPLDNSFCLKADAGKDTTINIGDSIFIGSYTNGIDSVKWVQNGVAIDSIRPGFWVKPTTGTSYILQQTVNGCFSADTVTIGVLVPLKFTNFTAQIQPTPNPSKEGNVLLRWQTANEINVSHFNIQRSLNGVAFTTIGKAVAQNKSINNYEFTDVLLPSLEGLGVGLFYRIQAIDKDGKISYSEIRTISYNHFNHSISVYPNPSNGSFVVKLQNAEKGLKQFKLVDMFGKIVWQKEYSYINADIKVATNVIAGVYILQIVNPKTGKTNVSKVIIN